MIDPINPGPAGTTGPAGSAIGAPSSDIVNSMLLSGTATIAQAIAAAMQPIREGIEGIFAAVNTSIQTAASSIASGVNDAQTAVNLAASTAQTSASTGLAAVTAGSPTQYTADQAGPNKTAGWNLWSSRVPTGWTKPDPAQYWTNYDNDINHCFRGWALVYADALALAASLPELPPNACPQPSFVITPPVGGPVLPQPCPSNLYDVWQQFLPDGSANCVELCQGTPGPAGFTNMGQTASPGANAPVGTVYQCIAPTKGTGGGVQYYAGCVSGKPVSWSSTDPAPAGVSGQVGPFADQGTALAAAGTCGGTGNGTGGTGGTGSGCCDEQGKVKLPDCIYIDLCDWSKFYDNMWRAIKKGMCEFILAPECQCPIHDGQRWVMEDCDGQADAMADAWKGQVGSVITNLNVDQLQEIAGNLLDGVGASVEDTGPDPFGPR